MYYILIPPCHPGAQGPHHTHLSSWGAGSPQKRMFLWGVFCPQDPGNMYFIIFFNIVSLRDKLIDLDPVVKPRGDKKRNPRNDKILKFVNKKIKHHTQFPSMEGCRAAAGWSENTRKRFRSVPRYAPHPHTLSCHCEPSQMAWQSLLYRCVPQCVARARMRPVRILVFVQTALALVFTYSDSLRAIADGAAIQ